MRCYCLSQVADLDRCHLYLRVFAELAGLPGKRGERGSPVLRIIAPLRDASIRHLQDADCGLVTSWFCWEGYMGYRLMVKRTC